MYTIPILFLIFRRPDVTVRVFEEIRKQQPRQLFIAADGGRTPEEHERCELTRQSVLDMIDWECDVKTLFRSENLGCRKAVSFAITWFFEHVEMGIILEEDCLPHPSFFPYCEELLKRYKDDTRIMCISGDNFQNGQERGNADYYFSNIMHCWGWASWRRAWKLNDAKMDNYQYFKNENIISNIYSDTNIQAWLISTLDSVYEQRLSSWAFIWFYSILCNNGLNILPNKNLVSNIGFDEESTHCRDSNSAASNMQAYELKIKNHPNVFVVDSEADMYTFYNHMGISKGKCIPLWKYIIKNPSSILKYKVNGKN